MLALVQSDAHLQCHVAQSLRRQASGCLWLVSSSLPRGDSEAHVSVTDRYKKMLFDLLAETCGEQFVERGPSPTVKSSYIDPSQSSFFDPMPSIYGLPVPVNGPGSALNSPIVPSHFDP